MSIWTVLIIIAIIIFAIIPTFKDRVIPVRKLLITPAIFLYLFYQTLNDNFHVHLTNGWIIVLGSIIGIAMGMFIRKNTSIKADKDNLLIWLPGNYLSLMIFFLIFSVHFAIGYLQAVYPVYLFQPNAVEITLLFLLSCVSSIIIGSNAFLYYKYLTTESSELAMNADLK